jgi:chemotaxis protein histidine kinase CheA
MRRRPPPRAALLAAAGLALLTLLSSAPALAVANEEAATIFSLEPDQLRVIKRRATVYLPGERGTPGKKWTRGEFAGGEEERRAAERDALRVLGLLREERALWAGLDLPPAVVGAEEQQQATAVNGTAAAAAAAAAPAAAGGNATTNAAAPADAAPADAPKLRRRSLLRKMLADPSDADASFDSFLEDIGARMRLSAPAAEGQAAAEGAAAAEAAPAAAAPAAPATTPAAAAAPPAADAPDAPAADALAAAANAAVAEAVQAEVKAAESVEQVVEDVEEVAAAVDGAAAPAAEAEPAAAEPAAAEPAADAPAAEEEGPQAEQEPAALEPQIGGLYAGRNYEGGFAVSQSWAALDAYEAANAPRASGTASSPGVALAVGHGQVLEVAGWTLRAYSALDGTPLTAPTPLSALFNVSGPVASASPPPPPPPSPDAPGAPAAALVGRAALAFDAHGTGRFYVAAHVQDVGPAGASGAPPRSRVVFAVSAGPNIVGSWYVYDLDVGFSGKERGGKISARAACTGGGSGSESGAQCWAGSLALGNDGQALYLTYDNYRRDPQQGYTFVGGNVVALDKFALASSVRSVAVAEWWVDSNPADEAKAAARGIVPAVPAPFVYTRNTAANFLSLPATSSLAGGSSTSKPSYLVHYGLKGAKAMRSAGETRGALRGLLSALRLEVRRVPASLPAPLAGGVDSSSAAVAQPPVGQPALLLSTTVGVTAQALEPADFPLGRTLGRDQPALLPSADAPPRLGGLRLIKDRLYTVASVRVPAAELAEAAAVAQEEGKEAEAGAEAAAAAGASAGSSRVAVWWLEIDQPAMKPLRSGVIAYDKGSLLAPTIAVSRGGRAVVAATAVGTELFPSAAVATLDFGAAEREAAAAAAMGLAGGADDEGGVSSASEAAALASSASGSVAYTLRLPGAGAGYADGEGAYYGGRGEEEGKASAASAAMAAAASGGGLSTASAVGVDGTLWSAAEVVAHACSLEEYRLDATCGGTRTAEFNWATRVTQMEADV